MQLSFRSSVIALWISSQCFYWHCHGEYLRIHEEGDGDPIPSNVTTIFPNASDPILSNVTTITPNTSTPQPLPPFPIRLPPPPILPPPPPPPPPSTGNHSSNGTNPNPTSPVSEIKFYAVDGFPFQKYGHAVSACGQWMAVSTNCFDGIHFPSVYLYSLSSVDQHSQQPIPTAILNHENILSLDGGGGSVGTVSTNSTGTGSSGRSYGYDGYGLTIGLSKQFLAVSAPYDSQGGYLTGRIYVYPLSSVNNNGTTSLKVEERAVLSGNSLLGSLYGTALSFWENDDDDGNEDSDSEVLLAVGATMDSTGIPFSGAVYLYQFSSDSREWQEETVIVAPQESASSYDLFGSQVSFLSKDLIAISAPGTPHYNYVQQYGGSLRGGAVSSVVINGYPAPSTMAVDVGKVYLFQKQLLASPVGSQNNSDSTTGFSHALSTEEEVWQLVDSITPFSLLAESRFGSTMAWNENHGFILANDEESLTTVICIYTTTALAQTIYPTLTGANKLGLFHSSAFGQWQLVEVLYPTTSMMNFGQSMTVSSIVIPTRSNDSLTSSINTTYLVLAAGAPGDVSGGFQSGAVYIFAKELFSTNYSLLSVPRAILSENDTINHAVNDSVWITSNTFLSGRYEWQAVGKLVANDSSSFDSYGHAVSPYGNSLLVGSILADTPVAKQGGAVYLESDLLPYLLATNYHPDSPDPVEDEDGKKKKHRWSFWGFLYQVGSSSGMLVTLACVPAAGLIVLAGIVIYGYRKGKVVGDDGGRGFSNVAWKYVTLQSFYDGNGAKKEEKSEKEQEQGLSMEKNENCGEKTTSAVPLLPSSTNHVPPLESPSRKKSQFHERWSSFYSTSSLSSAQRNDQAFSAADVYPSSSLQQSSTVPAVVGEEWLSGATEALHRSMRSFRQVVSSSPSSKPTTTMTTSNEVLPEASSTRQQQRRSVLSGAAISPGEQLDGIVPDSVNPMHSSFKSPSNATNSLSTPSIATAVVGGVALESKRRDFLSRMQRFLQPHPHSSHHGAAMGIYSLANTKEVMGEHLSEQALRQQAERVETVEQVTRKRRVEEAKSAQDTDEEEEKESPV